MSTENRVCLLLLGVTGCYVACCILVSLLLPCILVVALYPCCCLVSLLLPWSTVNVAVSLLPLVSDI